MKRIAVCPNISRDINLEETRKLCDYIKSAGMDCTVFPISEVKEPEVLSQKLDGFDAVVALGGDGTIMHAARAAALLSLPVLGINLGNLGYMAELEREELSRAVNALAGDTMVCNRMMLDVTVMRGGDKVCSYLALNEAAVRGLTRMVNVSVAADDIVLGDFSGDGVVCATPTGSTAYSLSAGGPIVEPTAHSILITPISAHALLNRSMVLSPERIVTITIKNSSNKMVYLSADGAEPFFLENGDTIRIKRSVIEAKFYVLGQFSFYDKVRRKLGGQP